MIFEQIAQIIEDAGLGTQGRDIFINNMPSTIKQGVLLKSNLAGARINHYNEVRKGKFHVVVRGENQAPSKQLCDDIIKSLRIENQVVSGIHIKGMFAETDPIGYHVSNGGFYEFGVTFQVIYAIV